VTLASATGQDNNQTTPAQPQYAPQNPWGAPQTGDLSGAFGAIASIQVQQQMSLKYGKLLLDFQSSMGWMQVAQGWASMDRMENAEDSEDEGDQSYDDVERNTERTLMHVLKIMYLQAAQKLNEARQSNYQTKVNLALLQQVGAGNPAISSVLYLMYYLESIRLLSSAITIQKQDAWNNWLLHEIMETDEFDNSRTALPTTFSEAMAHSRANAMQLYYTEASYDLQIFYLEYYIQMIAASFGGHANNNNNNAAAASSFLEEEMTAEPSKPFTPFTLPFMMMGGGGQYLGYATLFIKFYAVTMNVQAAQGLLTHAQADLNPSDVNAKYAGTVKQFAVNALQQWAYLKLQYTMIQMWGLFSGMPVPSAAAAHATA